MQFITTDINLACYLKMKGNNCTVQRLNRRGEFLFDVASKDDITRFFEDEGGYLTFSQTMRALKSQLTNLVPQRGDKSE